MSAEVAAPKVATAEAMAETSTGIEADPKSEAEHPAAEEVETEITTPTEEVEGEVEAEGNMELEPEEFEPEGPYEWPLKDRLVLMSAIVVSREDWSVVDEQMQLYAEAVVEMEEEDDEEIWRPEDWWTHDSCVGEYNRLLEEYKAEKEQKQQQTETEPQAGPSTSMSTSTEGAATTPAAIPSTPRPTATVPESQSEPESESSLAIAEVILRKLEEDREAELEEEIRIGVLEYKSGLEDIQRMEAADYGHIMEILADNEAFRRFMVEEGMEEEWEDAMDDYEDWQNLSPEEREVATAEAKARALAPHIDTEGELEVDVVEGAGIQSTMGPPPPAGTGPSSPKVSPQLKNLVYTKIAGTTEEDVGNLPAPASSPTLSMLLEMPPRGHGQPLPEIPTVAHTPQVCVEAGPSSTAVAAVTAKAEVSTKQPEGVSVLEVGIERKREREVEIKIEGVKAVAATATKEEGLPAELLGRTPMKAEPEDGEGKPGAGAEGGTSDSETTITGSITPPSQRGPGSVPTTPVGAGGTSPSATTAAGGRVTRRHAEAASASGSAVEEGKSLRGRTIVTTPTKEDRDKDKDSATGGGGPGAAAKDKVRVKLEFDATTKTLRKPPPVDFKTVAMKEKEGQGETAAGRDLRSRRSGAPATPSAAAATSATKPTSQAAAGATGSKTPKKDTSDEEEFVEPRPDVSRGAGVTVTAAGAGAEEMEAHARATATERWVEGSGATSTSGSAVPSKAATATTALGAAAAAGGAAIKKRRGDSSEERPTASTTTATEKEKEGEEKRVTRARTRTTPGAAPAATPSIKPTTTTMTPPATPTLSLTPAIHAQARSTPEPDAMPTATGGASASRALRSRQRLPDSFSFGASSGSGVEPSSPAPASASASVSYSHSYSTPHSPASSTTTSASAMYEEGSSSFAYGYGAGAAGGLNSSSGLYTSTEDKNMKRALLSLHRLVTNLKHAYIFLKTTIPKYSKPNFDRLIQRPLDFSVIKRAIESDSIRSFDAYQLQVSVMFMNHLMYFHEGLDLHKQTKQMANETFDIIEDFIRNYNESNAPRSGAGGGAAKREGRARDLRHSYSTTSSTKKGGGGGGAVGGTPTPSVADSGARGSRHASGSEESHDEGGGRGSGGGGRGASASGGPGSGQGTSGGGTGRGRGRRKKQVELSPSITDEPRKGSGRTPRGPGLSGAGASTAKTRHSAV